MNELEVTDEDLLKFIGYQQSSEIIPLSGLADQTAEFISKTQTGPIGDTLPWSKSHEHVAFSHGQLTIHAGINGHGKTTALLQAITGWVANRKVLIASMEHSPLETAAIMSRQAAGCYPSKDFVREFLASTEGHGWIFHREGRVEQDVMLGLAMYAGENLGIHHLVVDSLTMCGVGRDDYEKQGQFVANLRGIAKRYRMHIHLVCHVRKGQDESSPLSKFDIRGAGEITDIADKVLLYQRNKKREIELQAKTKGYDFDQQVIDQPGVYVRLCKNRQDGDEAVYGLYFHKDSLQLTEQDGKARQTNEYGR